MSTDDNLIAFPKKMEVRPMRADGVVLGVLKAIAAKLAMEYEIPSDEFWQALVAVYRDKVEGMTEFLYSHPLGKPYPVTIVAKSSMGTFKYTFWLGDAYFPGLE